MQTFKDSEGREWHLAVTIGAAKRIRDELGVNLLEIESGDPPLITRIGLDEILLFDIIFALLKPEADERGVDSDKFAAALDGDVSLKACMAFYDDLVLFFSARGRKDRATAVERQREMIAAAVEDATAKIEAIDANALLKLADGRSSTAGAESAA